MMKYLFMMKICISLLVLLLSSMTIGQSRWSESILIGDDVIGNNIKESYDHGYLLSGWYGGSYPNLNWLLKMDINGTILWGKSIGDNSSLIAFHRIDQNENGDIFLSGSTSYYDEYHW